MLEDNIPIHDIKSDISKLIDKVEDLEQKIINLNAKVNNRCKPKKTVKRVKVKTKGDK
jgi:cell division septum initiation protein DivIVA|tara:strand:- start:7093 stop:7266 length:174 start_codon:yes stop_codon:yes gene_type:complete